MLGTPAGVAGGNTKDKAILISSLAYRVVAWAMPARQCIKNDQPRTGLLDILDLFAHLLDKYLQFDGSLGGIADYGF